MKKTITILCLFISALIYAQNIITKSYLGPTRSINNSTGTFPGAVTFQQGIDFLANHKIVDVQVEIVWTKSDDGYCTPSTGTAPDLSHVGFIMKGPDNITRYLAHSATTASSASVPTTASFAGSVDIISDTIVFKDRARSLLPATLPRRIDTVSPNNDALSYYIGKSPLGIWRIGGIDDAPATGPALCIHSYLVQLTTSTMNVTGIATNQMVNENATLQPFSTINITHFNSLNVSATITLDNNAKGVLTGTGLSGTGPYTIASTTAADLQAKLRALSFNPTDNRAATTDTTTFTVKINDGSEDFTNNKTTVISKAIKPIFENSTPSISAITPSGFTLSTDINEAGTMYYVVVPEGATTPTTAEIKAGTGSGGSGQAASGTSTVNTVGFVNNFTITGLKGVTNYDVYVLAEDAGGATQLATKKVTTTASPTNKILYVKKGGAGTQNGSSWADAVDELSDALKWASTQNNNLKIYVAKGTYKPLYRADNMSGANANDQDNAFVLVDGVKLYGGFAGTETTLADRNLSLTANASILSGDIDNNDTVTNGISTTIAGNNAYHVVISVNDSNTTVLDGFTITGGKADGSSSITVEGKIIFRNFGGGMYNASSSPSITNSIFSGNKASSGGGMCNNNSHPSITNTIFSGNKASHGGGMLNIGFSLPNIINTIFSGNTATSNGGGMFNDVPFSIATIYNSIFWNNKKNGNNSTAGADISPSRSTIKHCLTQVYGRNGIDGNKVGTGTYNDPKFVNANNGDFRLQAGSPAINAGTNSITGIITLPTLPTTDKAGNNRIFDTTIDMGAYERQMKQQTITANNLTKNYGDADFTHGSTNSNLALTYSSGNTAVATIVNNKIHITGLGTATITVSQTGNTTYDPAPDKDFVLTVAKGNLTITADSKEYDASKIATVQLSGYSGYYSTSQLNLTGGTARFSDKNAGLNKTVTATGYTLTGTLANNFNLTIPTSLTANIIAKEVEVSLTGAVNKVYDGTTQATLAPGNFTITGVLASDTVTVSNTTGSYDTKDVGTSKTVTVNNITLDGADSNNYYLKNSRLNIGTRTYYIQINLNAQIGKITKAMLTATAEDKTKTYDGNVFPPAEYSVTYNGLVNNETATVLNGSLTFTGTSQTAKNVGANYAITPSGLTSDNYNISFVDGNLNITKASLTVTADAKTKVYDSAILPTTEYSVTYNGFVNNETATILNGTLNYGGTSKTAKNVGSYTIIPSGLTSDNYNITYANNSLIITKANITGITFTDARFTYDGTEKALAITGSLPSGTSVTYTNNNKTNAGTYQVTANINGGDNYTNQTLVASLTIKSNIAGDTNNNGVIDDNEIAGDLNGNGVIDGNEIAGDINGNGVIDGNEVVGDTNGDGVIDDNEIAGDINGDGVIDGNEVVGDTNGNGIIDGNEVVGDTNGDGVIGGNECSNEDRITRHWDDSLFFDNTGNEYTAWQWYKNGKPITGATQQFYSATQALSGNYHVVATNKKGLAITMCAIYIDGNQTVVPLLQVYPNPVSQGNQFTVKANFETNLLQGAVITMYNLEGKLLQTLNQVSAENKLTAPNVSGLYIIRIILNNGKQKSTNLVVR